MTKVSLSARHGLAVATALILACATPPTEEPIPPDPDPTSEVGPAPPVSDSPYPATRRDDIVEQLHGQSVADPFRWLEDAKADPVQAWMNEQDRFARDHLASLPGRDALEQRLIDLTYTDYISPPSHRGTRYFYARAHKDKEKEVYYYKEGKNGEEKVLLDANALSDDGSVAIKGFSPSRNGRWLAYKLSENNADASTMYVRDVGKGEDSKIDVIPGAKYAYASWTPDSKGFYYVRLPDDPTISPAELPGHAELRYHKLGTDPAKDELVHPALKNPSMFLSGGVSWDGHWLFLYKIRGPKNEVHVMDLRSAKGRAKGFQPIAEGFGASYGVTSYRDRFYVTTDEGAPNERVFLVDPRKLARDQWKELIPEDKKRVMRGAYIVGGKLITNYLVDAHSQVEIRDLKGKVIREVELPGVGSTGGLAGRPDEDTAYMSYSSFVQPQQTYETSVKTGKTKLWATVEYPVDTSQFVDKQVRYKSKDGTEVSMFIVHRKDIKLDGSNPTLLTGYGGFGVSLTPRFSSHAVAWVERGGVYAIPNLRGGGEYGESWHKAGMLGNKQNVFDDFLGAAEHLIAEGYTRPDRLAIRGGSNGGLLVGAAMVQRPELFGAVVCAVPLLDMVRYHLFGSGKTWMPEYGDPDNAEHFQWLYAYSPYHHVKPGTDYPALLMMSADSDDRVDPMHARKFIAAVQSATSNDKPMIMRIERKAGHGGAGTRKKAVASTVDVYAFLFDRLGMANAPAPAPAEPAPAQPAAATAG